MVNYINGGRKYGQGYSGDESDINGTFMGYYSDSYVPIIEEGPVPLNVGQSQTNENVCYEDYQD